MGYRQRRDKFCRVTWLSPYLSGERQRYCLLYLHQKVNCQTPKSNDDFSNWVEDHARLVNESLYEWRSDGGTATVEDQNYFKFQSGIGVCLGVKSND